MLAPSAAGEQIVQPDVSHQSEARVPNNQYNRFYYAQTTPDPLRNVWGTTGPSLWVLEHPDITAPAHFQLQILLHLGMCIHFSLGDNKHMTER